jgi:hypothetical protein
MSEEENIQAKGRVLADYLQAKDHHATLQAEARRVALVLQKITDFLRTGGDGSGETGGPLEDILSVKIAALVKDLQDARRHKDQLTETLITMGIPLQPRQP